MINCLLFVVITVIVMSILISTITIFIIIIIFSLEITVTKPAEFKLPIIREIYICMFDLYIKIKFFIVTW